MRDKDLQYAYAQATANSMMHLHDAIAELLENKHYAKDWADLKKTYGAVMRAREALQD